MYLNAIEVVDCQNRALLILIGNESVTFGLACLFISHQVDVDDFAISDRMNVFNTFIYQHLAIFFLQVSFSFYLLTFYSD